MTKYRADIIELGQAQSLGWVDIDGQNKAEASANAILAANKIWPGRRLLISKIVLKETDEQTKLFNKRAEDLIHNELQLADAHQLDRIRNMESSIKALFDFRSADQKFNAESLFEVCKLAGRANDKGNTLLNKIKNSRILRYLFGIRKDETVF